MRLLLFATIGVILGSAVYNGSLFNGNLFSESTEAIIPETNLQPDTQQVVYRFNAQAMSNLKQDRVSAQTLNAWKTSKQTLESYLQLSKQNNSSRYAATGLQIYSQLDPSIQIHPQVRLVHADLLQYVQDYNASYDELSSIKDGVLNQKTYFDQWKIRPNEMTEQINLKLFTHNIVKGDLSGAKKICQELRSTKQTAIPLICFAWIKGLKGSPTQGIAMLERLAVVLDENDPLKIWSAEALIDLYLYSGDSKKAIAAYNYLVKINFTDLNIASQIIDFLILHNEDNIALALLNTLPDHNSLILRRAIVDARLNRNSKFEAQAQTLIQMYELKNDPAHYYDIALWHATKTNQQRTAWRYVNLHWDRFKSFHDKALLQTIDNVLNPTVSAQSET